MEHQNSIGVSHSPVFVKNIFYSVLFGVHCIIRFIFGSPRLLEPLAIFVGLFSILGLRNRNKLLTTFWVTLIAVYLLYFILVACSFYAYNAWSGLLGCNNFGMGRYTLYMAPLVLITLIYGLYNFKERICENGKHCNIIRYCLWGIILIFVCAGVRVLIFKGLLKGNDRDAYEAWEASGGAKNVTVIHNFTNPTFMFYFMHSEQYNAETRKNVIGEGKWGLKATPEERYQKLDSIGVYKHDIVYVVTLNEYSGHPANYDSVMKKAGYSNRYILDARKDNGTSLIVYSK